MFYSRLAYPGRHSSGLLRQFECTNWNCGMANIGNCLDRQWATVCHVMSWQGKANGNRENSSMTVRRYLLREHVGNGPLKSRLRVVPWVDLKFHAEVWETSLQFATDRPFRGNRPYFLNGKGKFFERTKWINLTEPADAIKIHQTSQVPLWNLKNNIDIECQGLLFEAQGDG